MRAKLFTAALITSGVVFPLPAGLRAQVVPNRDIAPEFAKKTTPDVISLITQAVGSRLGDHARFTVWIIDPPPAGQFIAATPDPLGRLGSDMNFTLTPAGAARTVRVRVRVDVTAPQVRAVRAILRGHVVAADDVAVVEEALTGVPVKRLPQLSQIVGQQALRPIDAGQIVESSFVSVRRTVQSGDKVTVIATVGAVQVTAQFVAADSGDPGDIVRVVNRDTHRTIQARVVSAGIVEVMNVIGGQYAH